MQFNQSTLKKVILFFLLLVLAPLVTYGVSMAAQLRLTWADNSTNEDGFKIDRKTGTNGTYAQVASLGANVTTYTDSTVIAGTTYCYRVYAFNAAGNSPYTLDACGAGPVVIQTFTLTVAKVGTGTGTVAATGINCGSDCSQTYNSGTSVALTASPGTGSTFASWSGTGCSSGTVTLSANRTCTATFNGATQPRPDTTPPPIPWGITITLQSTSATNAILSISWPASIDQPSNTAAPSYKYITAYNDGSGSQQGTIKTNALNLSRPYHTTGLSQSAFVCITAVDAAGNQSSEAGCNGFVVPARPTTQTFILTVAKVGNGGGTVAATGINCGSDCSETYNSSTGVTLTATPATGSTFAGWSGTGCSSSFTISSNVTCTATFDMQNSGNPLAAKIGVFRPSTGEWFLDGNGNGSFDNCATDACASNFGNEAMLPIVGDWFGTGKTNIGVFDPNTGKWHLDNGNRAWDACETTAAGDFCIADFGDPGSFPVVKEIRDSERLIIGTFQPRTTTKVRGRTVTKEGLWKFDTDGDGVLDSCGTDQCIENFGTRDDLPIVGNWNGSGVDKIGIFRPQYGYWYLDINGNGKWDGTRIDSAFGPFGRTGDLPVVGDWKGTGKLKIGVFRPSTGQWFLDLNGNGKLDSCTIDACLTFGHAGDLPVVGNW